MDSSVSNLAPPAAAPPTAAARRQLVRLLALFGTLYFVQGVIEPTACLPMQPIQTQLRGWGFSADQVGKFFGIIGIAWSIKPLFGLLSDFFPLAGYRRWPYLLLSTAGAAAAFLAVAAVWGRETGGGFGDDLYRWLAGLEASQLPVSRSGWLMIAAGLAIALTDVVVDALAVEEGQPLGITGQIQAVQWGAMSLAGILAGEFGGLVAGRGWQREMFLGCGLLALVSVAAVLLFARERRGTSRPGESLAAAFVELRSSRRLGILLMVSAFLFLWNFNPFSGNVTQQYLTEELGLGEEFYGHLLAVMAIANTAACGAYFWYCRRIPFGRLIHWSIATGVLATLAYWCVDNWWTAMIASVLVGLTYQTGLLIQLDLAARVCPTASAGTMFALLMAISNTGNSLGIYLGGGWYDRLHHWLHGRDLAFHALVLIGAAFTAGCWLLVPLMKRAGVEWR